MDEDLREAVNALRVKGNILCLGSDEIMISVFASLPFTCLFGLDHSLEHMHIIVRLRIKER